MKHEYLKPIRPLAHFAKEGEEPNSCNRKWLPKKHSWHEVRNTSAYSYQECSRCHNKRIIQIREGYQPIAMGWEGVWKEQLKNRCTLL